jgi:hypothetical protein
MSNYTALFDANVLYPAPLRDVLMQLAVTDLFRAKWSADIHREWMEHCSGKSLTGIVRRSNARGS